jgi:integrase/recombinase XerD
VYRRLRLLFHFGEFAQKKGCKDVASCKAYIKEFVSHWLEQHGAKAKTAVAVRKHTIDAECCVRQMLQLACKEPVTRNRRQRQFPLESFRQLCPAVLAAFIVQYRPKVAPRTRLGFCCHLRGLLRFCYREGITTRDLSGAVGTPQIYRLNDVPRSIAWDDVRRMLEVVERRTIRDGAITRFCFSWSPMVWRAHEVARLTLDDVDCKRERLQVLALKARSATRFWERNRR